MKHIIKLIIVLVIIVGGYAVYKKTDGNISMDEIKKLSVADMTDSLTSLSNVAIEQLNEVNTKELMNFAVDNKDDVLSFLEDNNISLEDVDMNALNKKLEENGLSLEKLGVIKDEATQSRIKELIESVRK